MSKLWKNVLVLWAIGMGLGMSGLALGATGTGPYYATPSWDQTLPAATRFVVLTNMGSVAVLDRETGLVWEQSPSQDQLTWEVAKNYCITTSVGNRKGWRLPNVQELASLIDTLQAVFGSALPSGHPFSNVGGQYWTGSNHLSQSSGRNFAWTVDFNNGGLEQIVSDFTFNPPPQSRFAWCVRGGQGPDLQ